MLVCSIRRILHDANVHRLSNRYSNRLSCVVIDEARRTFEEDIGRVLVDIKLAKRLQRVVAAAPHPEGKLIAPTPRQPYSPLTPPQVARLADTERTQTMRRADGRPLGRDLAPPRHVVPID